MKNKSITENYHFLIKNKRKKGPGPRSKSVNEHRPKLTRQFRSGRQAGVEEGLVEEQKVLGLVVEGLEAVEEGAAE